MIGSDNLCVDSKTRIQKAASVLKNGKKSVYLPTIFGMYAAKVARMVEW